MASEIRVNKINSRTGVGTITLSPTGVDFTGIATVATLKATTGIVTTLSVTGTTTLNGNLDLQDNDKILAGTGDDLEFYHDGTHSHIVSNTGNLRILADGSGSLVLTSKAGEEAITCAQDGAVTIKHDNSTKFTTKSDGIDVTGEVQCDSLDVDGGHINLESGYSLQWGDSHERIEQSDQQLEFFTNNTQKMTLSASKLGLGTSSNLNGLLTLHQNDDQLFLKQTDGDSGFLIGSNNTNGNLNLKRRAVGSNTTIATFLAAGGLTFNGDTATANALDDYEEGTWTPGILRSTTNPTVATSYAAGKYTKIGNQVLIYFDMNITTLSGGSGRYYIYGLPFSTSTQSNNGGYGAPQFRDSTAFPLAAQQIPSSYHATTTIQLRYMSDATTESDIAVTTGRITGWSVYFTDS